MDRKHLPVSLLDDLSCDVNNTDAFKQMVDSADGIDTGISAMLIGDEQKKIPPRITDPRKRLVAFVIEKLKEVADDYTDRSTADVRVFEYKLDPKQKYNFQTVFPNTLTTYLWRDNKGLIQSMFSARCEYQQDQYSGNSYRSSVNQSSNLAGLLARLGSWERQSLDEYCIIDDLRAFPLKQPTVPSLKSPVPDRSVPFRVHEGEMIFDSDRDTSGKPVVASIQPRMSKKAMVSVQMFDYGKTLAVQILYKSI
jgi:hypothetical protein